MKPRPTNTPRPSSNPRPTNTPRVSNNPQATNTPRPSNNPQATNTPRPSNNPQATNTPRPNNPQATNTPRPTSAVPANQIPNCFDLKGPTQFRVGETVTFTANFSSPQNQLAGEIFVANATAGIGHVLKHQQLSGDRGSITDATWTPNASDVGTHTIVCRAWNDGVAECIGGNITLGASNKVRCPGTDCNGATTSLSVEVYPVGAVIPTVTSTPAISQNPGATATPIISTGPTATDMPLPTSVCVAEQISWTKFAGEHIYERSMVANGNSGNYRETLTLKMAPMVNETAPIEISIDGGSTWKTFDQKGDRTYYVNLKNDQFKQAVQVQARAKVCNGYSNVITIDVPALIPSITTPSTTARPNAASGRILPAVVVGVAAIAVIGAAMYFTGT